MFLISCRQTCSLHKLTQEACNILAHIKRPASTITPIHVELTSKRYKVERGNYAKVIDQDVQYFKSLLGPTRVLTDESDLAGYNVDWLQMVRGKKTANFYLTEDLVVL